jgi:glutamate decarboxylase
MQDLYNARLLSNAIERSGYYDVLSDIHRPANWVRAKGKSQDPEDPENYAPGLPVVAFRFSEAFRKEYPNLQVRA